MVAGTVYLVHFSRPLHHARHYLGWTAAENLANRLARHAAGRGARILRAVTLAGIPWELVAVAPGTRASERQLKRGKHIARICPACRQDNGRAWERRTW